MKLKLIIGIVGILSACGFTNAPSLDTNQEKQDNNWVIGPFLRPEGVNPVISPQPTEFYCPMRKQQVKWEESDTFNPAATVKDGKIVVLYRAEDNSAQGIGKRTSRVGYAESISRLYPGYGANDGGRPSGSHSNFYPVFDLSKIFCSGCGDERTERIEVLRILYGSIKQIWRKNYVSGIST